MKQLTGNFIISFNVSLFIFIIHLKIYRQQKKKKYLAKLYEIFYTEKQLQVYKIIYTIINTIYVQNKKYIIFNMITKCFSINKSHTTALSLRL